MDLSLAVSINVFVLFAATLPAHAQEGRTSTPPRPLWCERASNPTHIAICKHDRLWTLDACEDELFRNAQSAGSDRAARQNLVAEERKWVAQRNACASSAECIAQRYKERIAQLESRSGRRCAGHSTAEPRTAVARKGPIGVRAEVTPNIGTAPDAHIHNALISPGDRLIVAYEGTTISVWDIATGRLLRTLQNNFIVWSMTISPDGRYVASGHKDGSVRLWLIENGALQLEFPHDAQFIYSLSFSRDGTHLASSSEGVVKIWNTQTGALLRAINPERPYESAYFSNDGERLHFLNGSSFGLWSVSGAAKEGRPATLPRNHTLEAFLSDRRALVRVSKGDCKKAALKLWNLTNNREISTIETAPDGECTKGSPSWLLLFEPYASRFLVARSKEKIIRDVESGDLRETFTWEAQAEFPFDASKEPEFDQASASGGRAFADFSHVLGSGEPLRLWSLRERRVTRAFVGGTMRADTVLSSPLRQHVFLANEVQDQRFATWDILQRRIGVLR